MPSNEPRETTLYAELIRRGLPADYAERTVSELDDHRADLLADLRAAQAENPEAIADQRLGETRQLARKIAADYQRRSWWGRWPLIGFLILPIPLLAVSWIGSYLLFAAVAFMLEALMSPWDLSRPSVWVQRVVGEGVLLWFFAVVPGLLAFAWARLPLRFGLPRVYAVVPCLVLAVFVGSGFCTKLKPSPVPGEGRLFVSFPAFIGDSTGNLRFLEHPKQLLQYGAPLVAGVALLVGDERRRRLALRQAAGHDDKLPLAA